VSPVVSAVLVCVQRRPEQRVDLGVLKELRLVPNDQMENWGDESITDFNSEFAATGVRWNTSAGAGDLCVNLNV